jgi:hypothetical protein
VVHSYLVAPPAGAALLLDVERRLRDKLGTATRAIGRGLEVVPSLTSAPAILSTPEEGSATRRGEAMAQVARWARATRGRASGRIGSTLVAAARCEEIGWLAALDDGRLVASLNEAPPAVDDAVARGVQLGNGRARLVGRDEAAVAVAQCAQWINAELLARQCGQVRVMHTSDRSLDRRVALAVARTPRHLRASAAAHASQLMAAATLPRPLGAERALRRAVDDVGKGADSGWLEQAAELELVSPRGPARRDGTPRIVALIVLGPGDSV